MFKVFHRNTFISPVRNKGGESLFVAIIACALVSLVGLSLTKLHNASFRSLLSSEATMQAQHYAKTKMDYLVFCGYNRLATQGKTTINDTTYKDDVVLGTVAIDSNGVSRRTVTVNVYNEDENAPRASLSQVFYSNDANRFVVNGSSTTNSISLNYDSTKDKLYAKVDGNEKLLGGISVPSGTVLSWYGNIANIPDGFVLCDGNNGTPDLRDRFIVGAGSAYSLGAVGGATHIQLSWNEMPSHSHTRGTMEIWGNFGGTDVQGGYWGNGSFYVSSYGNYNDYGGSYHSNYGSTMSFNASRTWSGETSYAGSNWAHENRPPYYALYYIMKL